MHKEKTDKPQLYLVQMGIRPIDIMRVSIYAAGQNYSDLINTRLKLASLGRTLEQQDNHILLLKEHHLYCHHVDETIKLENKSLNTGIDEWQHCYDTNNQSSAAKSCDSGHMDQHHANCILSLGREWIYCNALQKFVPTAIIQSQLDSIDQLIQHRRKRIHMLKSYAQNPERMHLDPSRDYSEDDLQMLVENARNTPVKDMRPGPLLLSLLVNPKGPMQ